MNRNKSITIGLMWHSLTSGNLGVGALTESNIAIISDIAAELNCSVRFVIFGVSEDRLPSYEQEIINRGNEISVERVRVYRRSFREGLRSCDFVLDIGAGDSFADIYGFSRFFYYWLSKLICNVSGTALALSPQTIGPFSGLIARKMATFAMKRCKKVFARDNMSTQYLKSLGVVDNIEEAIDVAFRLPYSKVTHGNEKMNVGVNVSGLLLNGGYTGNNQFNLTVQYPDLIRSVLKYFTALNNVQVHLVSHVLEPDMPVEDDYAASKALQLEFPSVILAPVFLRPSEAKSYIAGLDFFTGARMHACIAAFSSGVPVIPMAYSRKFNGLFGTLEYSHVADLKAMTNQEAFEKIVAGYDNRIELSENVAAGNRLASVKMQTYESYLRNALANSSRS